MFSFFKSSYSKFKEALTKSHSFLGNGISRIFNGPVDESSLEDLERLLYEADLGSDVSSKFIENLRPYLRKKSKASPEEITNQLKILAKEILDPVDTTFSLENSETPKVILVIGVNGCGKTTSVAKIANLFKKEGKKVILSAADTFRAAAPEQLAIFAQKCDIDLVRGLPQCDPSAVVFDTLSSAISKKADIVLIDTAGRLQNKTDLMKELDKIKRVCGKTIKDAPHESWLVIDATSGQNALEQAQEFHKISPLTGIILTKLDSSSKGGIILPIYSKLKIPVLWIGTGESLEDILPFNSKEYLESLFN